MMARPSRHAARAFTLVEVLATLTLMAIILPVAMHGVSIALALAGDAKHRVEAAGLAEAKLNELLATGGLQGPDLSGDFGPDRPQYRWSAEVADWDEPMLREVTVRVAWTSRNVERSVALTTLLYTGESL